MITVSDYLISCRISGCYTTCLCFHTHNDRATM